MKRVEGYDSLYKDPQTGVLLNCNQSDRNKYRLSKQQAMSVIDSQAQVAELKKEVNEIKELKDEVRELKELITKLLNN